MDVQKEKICKLKEKGEKTAWEERVNKNTWFDSHGENAPQISAT